MKARKINSNTYPIVFSMTRSGSAIIGITPIVLISKNGGAFTSPQGSVVEVGNGFYSLSPNSTDRNTLGELNLYITSASTNPSYETIDIVNYDPFSMNSDIRDAVWSGISRTLTYSPQNLASITNGDLAFLRGDTIDYTFYNLDLTNYASSFFTIKKNYQQDDCDSIVQVSSASGLVYLNGVKLSTGSANASIISGSASLTIKIAPSITKQFPYSSDNYYYDLQVITVSGSVTTPELGEIAIIRDVTKRII